MTIERLERALPEGERLLLDTTVLGAFLDATEAAHPVAKTVIEDLVRTGRNPAVVSMVTVMEILVRPLRASPPRHNTVLAFLRSHPNLELAELDIQMAQDAAMLRVEHGLRPPDALVIGTGLACQVGHLVTNDGDWARKLAKLTGRIRVCTIKDFL